MKLIKVLLFLWQLPQNILGLLLLCFGAVKHSWNGFNFYTLPLFESGVCLGQFIFLDMRYLIKPYYVLERTLKHEYGHKKQSLYLGCFYLFVVGIPSIVRNVYYRLSKKETKLYYRGFPEDWADRLGGVER